jgi:hypothetical protein
MKMIVEVDLRSGWQVDREVDDVAHVPRIGDAVMLDTTSMMADVKRVVWDYKRDEVRVYTKTY